MATKAHQEDLEFGTWQTPATPFTVEYSLHVLEELRAYAEEGFKRIPHGGIEVGALLLGSVEGSTVRVSEWRAMECEHARGPGFLLSEHDLHTLGQLLEATAAEPLLREMVPVGWLHTHTRSALFLSEEDIAIHNRFFPDPAHFALVLTMSKDQPARAGFFFRTADGAIDGSASPLAFAVPPNSAMLLRPPRKTAAPSRPRAATASSPVAGPPPRRTGPSRARPLGFSPDALDSKTPPPVQQGVQSYPSPYEPAPPALLEEPPGVAFRWRMLAVAVVVLALAATAVFTRPLWMPSAADSLALRVDEVQDQIVIRWDHSAPAVLRAQRALLEINDGSQRKRVELTQEETRRGTVSYVRTGEDVEVRLVLFENNRPGKEESSRFLGPPVVVAVAPAPPPSDPETLLAERERLRAALREERARSERLRQSVRQLENRLQQ